MILTLDPVLSPPPFHLWNFNDQESSSLHDFGRCDSRRVRTIRCRHDARCAGLRACGPGDRAREAQVGEEADKPQAGGVCRRPGIVAGQEGRSVMARPLIATAIRGRAFTASARRFARQTSPPANLAIQCRSEVSRSITFKTQRLQCGLGPGASRARDRCSVARGGRPFTGSLWVRRAGREPTGRGPGRSRRT